LPFTYFNCDLNYSGLIINISYLIAALPAWSMIIILGNGLYTLGPQQNETYQISKK